MDEKDFFVGIYDPADVRRNLLESSKEVVKSLQAYEKLHVIRTQKLKRFKDMKKVMNELDMLIEKLNEKLPKSHLRTAIDVPQTRTNFSSELQKLEEQLSAVEKELSSM